VILDIRGGELVIIALDVGNRSNIYDRPRSVARKGIRLRDRVFKRAADDRESRAGGWREGGVLRIVRAGAPPGF